MFETSKHAPKIEKRCCVFKDNHYYIVVVALHFALIAHTIKSQKSKLEKDVTPIDLYIR